MNISRAITGKESISHGIDLDTTMSIQRKGNEYMGMEERNPMKKDQLLENRMTIKEPEDLQVSKYLFWLWEAWS